MISLFLWYHRLWYYMLYHIYGHTYDVASPIFHTIYDRWISPCSPLPGLHYGLDSSRFNTITIEQLTVHCRQLLWGPIWSNANLSFGVLYPGAPGPFNHEWWQWSWHFCRAGRFASAAEGRSSKYIYPRGSRGMLSNIVHHMLYHMQ